MSVKSGNPSITQETDIAGIRQTYQQINSLNLTKQRFTYESPGCVEDGIVNYFFDHSKIVKITESGAIGDGSWAVEYYYSAGKVVFCLETIVGGPAIGKVTKSVYRYYIKNGRPVRVMEGSKIITANSKAAEIIQTANKIYDAYASKDFISALCK
ncbi:hypothetical protein [Mucilaginibacter lacusdianchii]|uniref:hypothetical protein n=1 Tax=Mucilaginibacter lacusdianchii TaxID=2684211 RepID=UPI00131BCF01|nr:hypothetical protein [Mucilaginibacter sp. JXJ CY 39]